MREATGDHSFVRHPHRTLVRLTVPVLISLIAEPLTGLADTAFVARLGATPLAALGVGTVLLSSVFWVFNFLGIGTQTEVAHALGNPGDTRARRTPTAWRSPSRSPSGSGSRCWAGRCWDPRRAS